MASTAPEGVTRDTWRSAPGSRWAFRNIAALLPVAEIAAGDPDPLPEDPVDLSGFRLQTSGGETLHLHGFLKATATDGLVIVRDGRLVYEFYADGMTPETPHILMSASKAVTGLLAGALVGENRLDLAAPVSRYVPEIANGPYGPVKVRDLLDMRSGVTLSAASLEAYAAATNWEPDRIEDADAGLHSYFQSLSGPPAAPDGPFRYVSANTDLLGWVLERASGEPFADLVCRALWRPMGAASPAAITLDRFGAPRATGGLVMTTRDFARLGALVLDGGRSDAGQVVPEAWIEDLFAGGDTTAWAEGDWGRLFTGVSRVMSHRSGWYITHDRPGSMFAMGIHGQNLFVDQQSGVVIARLASQAEPFDVRLAALTHRAVPLLRELARAG